MSKTGWKTSEWQISVGLILAMAGAAATAMLKYMESNPNPGWLTLALVAIAAAAVTGGSYSFGRSMVKAAEAKAKHMIPVILLGLLTWGSTAQAQELPGGLRLSMGPSAPLAVYTFGEDGIINGTFQVGAGIGVQGSVTHPKFEMVFGGQTWDGLSLTAVAYGRVVSPSSQVYFGELTIGVGVCTLSNAICAVGLRTLIGESHWGLGLSWSINFAGGGGEVATYAAKPPRANTLTLWR